MNSPQAKVIDQVDEKEIVGLASELIKIPSFKPEETPVATFLADFFGEKGYKVELQEVEPGRFQTIATLEGTGGGPSLMLNGHIDINSLTRRGRRDPWSPVVEGDRLYGHGVQNMAVVAEPFGASNLVTVHSGIVHMAIHTYGVTGHVRQLEGTVNAVVKMTAIINALQQVEFTCQPREDLPDLPKLNVGSVIGGLGEDYILVEPPYIPDMCTIIVDVHFLPGQTVDSIVADIRRVLDPLLAEDPELSYEIEIPPPDFFKGRRRLVMDPLDVPQDAEIVQAVARSHEDVTGQTPQAIGTVLPYSYTANDTCHLWNAGIPCLLYGPSVIRGSGDEDDSCVIISEMVQCTKVIALTALDVCQVESE